MSGTDATAEQHLLDAWTALADLASDLDLGTLLERIVTAAARLGDARVGAIDVVDADVAQRLGAFAAVGEGVHDGPGGRRLLADLMGRRAPASTGRAPTGLPFVGVPITVEGVAVANLYLLERTRDREFTIDDERLASTFASAAGVVIGAALRRERSARDQRWLDASSEIANALLNPVPHREAWQLIADTARDLSEATCTLLLLPRDGELHVAATAGEIAEPAFGASIPMIGTLVGDVARSGRTVVLDRADQDRRWSHTLTPGWPILAAAHVLPLRSGRTTGTLVLGWSDPVAYDRAAVEPEVAQRFADQAALVLQMTRAQDDQRRLAVLEDRDRISRDLHDVVIQRLYAVGLGLDQVEDSIADERARGSVQSAIEGIDTTIDELRRTIAALADADTLGPDLPEQITHLVDEAAGLLGFAPELVISGPARTRLDAETRSNVLAVTRELLSNVVQHAGASTVRVEVEVQPDLTLRVSDDGHGFGPSGDGNGNGLRNIVRRAELLGGTCEVDSSPGGGTTIVWKVPL